MPVTQPLILLDSQVAPPDERPHQQQESMMARPAVGVNRRGRLRHAATWCAALLVALIAVVELRDPGPAPDTTVRSPLETDTTITGPTDVPALVIREAPPDEAVTLLSLPGHPFCGDVDLRLDGSPIGIRLLVETDAGLLVTFAVPHGAAPGAHSIELIAGIPTPKAMGACREGSRHRRTIAAASVRV